MTALALVPHPTSVAPAGIAVTVNLQRAPNCGLRVYYRLAGSIDKVRIPPRAAAARAAELWQKTCFELFVAPVGVERYLELNLSPSTEWAAYAFDGYRRGMRPLDLARVPMIHAARGPHELVVTASVELDSLVTEPSPWRVGVTAVIEDTERRRSYWALQHPTAQPDFHAAAGWVARIEEQAG